MGLKDRLYEQPVVGTALRVQDRYALDRANQLAAAVGFFGFLSLFPLVALAVSIAGFVLGPAQLNDVQEAIQNAVPGLGSAIDIGAIAAAKQATGIVAILGLLWSGLKVVDSAQEGTSKVFRVTDPGNFIQKKVRSLVALFTLGVVVLLSSALGTVAGSFDPTSLEPGVLADVAGRIPRVLVAGVGFLISAALDTGLFLAAYRVLSVRKGPSIRQLLPGAILAALGWSALKIGGTALVASQTRSNAALGAIAGVLGALFLLYLAGRIYFYGAELAAVQAGIPNAPAAADPEPDALYRATGDDDPEADALGRGDEEGEDVTSPDGREPAAARPSGSDQEAGTEVEPPPLPSAPAAGEPSPAVSPVTRAAVAQADARNRAERDPNYVRKALAFAIAVGSVAGLARFMLGDDD